MKPMLCVLWAGALLVAATAPIRADEPTSLSDKIEAIVSEHLASHPEEVERIVKDYLIAHPEAIQAAIVAMLHKSRAARAQSSRQKTAAVHGDNAELLDSTHQVTLGAKNGDVTLVEFFDYNCGYCRRALPDMLALLEAEPNLKIVLREFPVLGPRSVEAARVAIAVRMEDVDGSKYLEFHRQMLSEPGPNDETRALVVAANLGFDPVKLRQDMASDEVNVTLAESAKLAKDLGLAGTPGYVVGENVIVGAVGFESLEQKIKSARER